MGLKDIQIGDKLVATKVNSLFDFDGKGEQVVLVAVRKIALAQTGELYFGRNREVEGIVFNNYKTGGYECTLCWVRSCGCGTRSIYGDIQDSSKNYRVVNM